MAPAIHDAPSPDRKDQQHGALHGTAPPVTDFFHSYYGLRHRRFWRRRRLGPVMDWIYDLELARRSAREQLLQRQQTLPVQRVLLTAVEVPSRKAELHAVIERMCRETRHQVEVRVMPMQQKGKFQNIQDLLRPEDPNRADWLLVIDDDIVPPPFFVDRLLFLSHVAGFKISQPAHRFFSHASFDLTLRAARSLARRTRFVECGPVTLLHHDIFEHVLPFVELRWAWGIDVWWSELAWRYDFPIGIVDATPIEHTRPVAATYSSRAAVQDADQFFAERQVSRSRQEFLQTVSTMRTLPEHLAGAPAGPLGANGRP